MTKLFFYIYCQKKRLIVHLMDKQKIINEKRHVEQEQTKNSIGMNRCQCKLGDKHGSTILVQDSIVDILHHN